MFNPSWRQSAPNSMSQFVENTHGTKTGNVQYLQGNIVARSSHHCFSGLAKSVTYFESIILSVGIQHAMRVRHIAICGLPRSSVTLHIIENTARFSEEKLFNIKFVF